MKRLSSLMLRKWKEKERWTRRRRSEPCGGEEEEEEGQTDRRMTRRKSEPCGRLKDCRRTECVEEEWTRKSSSWVLEGPGAGGHADRRWTRRRRSEPCATLHSHPLPVSNRSAGGTSCSELEQPGTAAEVRHGSRGRSQPAGPLERSKLAPPTTEADDRKGSNQPLSFVANGMSPWQRCSWFSGW